MSLLLCTFASKRSEPEKIRRWIAHLDELQKVHGDDPDSRHFLEMLHSRAVSWLDQPGGAQAEVSVAHSNASSS